MANSKVSADMHPETEADHPVTDPQQVVDDPVLAYVYGQPYTQNPKDLYIPPEAMEVILEAFEGPLDLLLYLIRRHNLDVLDIPLAEITRQYMEYVELMKTVRLELAAEYLVMAALLGEIKSRCLLPRQVDVLDDEEDPRKELIRRLQEYEQFKVAAQEIDELPRLERDTEVIILPVPFAPKRKQYPELDIRELILAFNGILQRSNLYESHQVQKEALSLRERMSAVLSQLKNKEFLLFTELFVVSEGRGGLVVSFMAMLELLKEGLIEAVQHEPFSPIYIAARTRIQAV